jgi:Ca2+-binding RTX toxin-like protein
VIGLAASSPAGATTVRNCAAGEGPYTNCNSFCTFGGSGLTCDTRTLCGTDRATAYAVQGYGGVAATSDYSAYVSCYDDLLMITYGQSCCAVDETNGAGNEVDFITLIGTDNDDYLSFEDPLPAGLQPAHAHALTATIFAGDSDCDVRDYVYGSWFSGGDYGELLYGEEGCDYINGGSGNNKIFGGPGDDEIYAENGADRIDPGDGADIVNSGGGNDNICDTTCGLNGGHDLIDAYEGNDRIWYEDTCNNNKDLDVNSTAGLGTDDCGDSNEWGALPWNLCDGNLTTKPTTCP